MTNAAGQTATVSLTESRVSDTYQIHQVNLHNTDMKSGRHIYSDRVSYFLCFEPRVSDQDSESAFRLSVVIMCVIKHRGLAHTDNGLS